MHELSYVRAILRMVEDIRIEHPGLPVLEVHASVGAATGALTEYLVSYYTEATAGTDLESSVLIADIVPVRAHCLDCDEEYEPDRAHHYLCPNCGSGRAHMVAGRDIMVDSVVFGDISGKK